MAGSFLSLLSGRYLKAIPDRLWPYIAAALALGLFVTATQIAPLHDLLLVMPRLAALVSTFLLGGIVASGTFFLAVRHEDAQALLPIDISITGIQSGPWPVYTKPPVPGEIRPMPGGKRIILTPVLITNRSEKNRVNLRFKLQVTLKGKTKATTFLLEEDSDRPSVLPTDIPRPLLGPLDIGPEQTVQGSITFYVSNMLPFFGEVTYGSRAQSNTLFVTDLVSGKTREFRVPTSMGGRVIDVPE